MDENIRRPRTTENADERAERLVDAEQQQREDDAANDERIDEMVIRNVKQRGP